MDVVETIGVWLHALSTVVVLGFYTIFARVVLPALARELEGPSLGRAVVAVERAALPFVLAAVVVFTVTGLYLLFVDDAFAGLGRSVDSAWSTLMLAKHVLVGLMVVGGVLTHFVADQLTEADRTEAGRRAVIGQLRLASDGMAALGAVILLLTAAAQSG